MSKAVKKLVSIAAPIVGAAVGGPVGAAVGGAVGGFASGKGIKGAAMGAITGYLGSQAGNIAGIGTAAKAGGAIANPNIPGTSYLLDGVSKAAAPAATSSIGGTLRSLVAPITQNVSPTMLLNAASGIVGENNEEAAAEAARLQAQGIKKGIAANTAALSPYTDLGRESAQRIQDIQADPAGYIQNNPLYGSLAADAERRLLANQAAKGKVGSGGTADALQERLLNIGTGLVNTEIGNLQNQVNTGSGAAGQVGYIAYAGNSNVGSTNAAGVIGQNNALNAQYQNQINTILAAQGLNRAPIYSQPINL